MCYCKKLPSQNYPPAFWTATAMNGTYANTNCYSGTWSVINTGLVEAFCFAPNSMTPSYVGISIGLYLKVAQFTTKPSASLFKLRAGCAA